MLTAPYIHFNNNNRPPQPPQQLQLQPPSSTDAINDNNVMTMIDYTNLYIKNLDSNVNSYELFNRFRVFGKIISARVMKDTITGKSKGYGFVSFSQMDEANEALRQMDGTLLNTRNIVVTFHEHKKTIKQQDLINLTSPVLEQQQRQTPLPPSVVNPWNETGIWMQQQQQPLQKSLGFTPTMYHPSTTSMMMHHVPTPTPTTTLLVSQQRPSIQYQKLRDAIYSQLSEYQQKDLNDLVDLIQSLKKRDLSLCLFNPTFLKQKIDEAYEALYLFQNTTSINTTPSLMHREVDSGGDSHSGESSTTTTAAAAATAIITSLDGMTMNKKKRVFGDIFFPYVRATGVKHAPKVTIRLLDTVPLDELAFNMYDKKELTRKAQYAYSELYC